MYIEKPISNRFQLCILDTIPIKNDSNDWEAAFGFKSSEVETIPGDDDLGFDPFAECSKGLADLMEKEMSTHRDFSQQVCLMVKIFKLSTASIKIAAPSYVIIVLRR